MRFWDSSALVPLVIEEARSATCRRWYRADAGIVVWTLTRTEIVAALRRRERQAQVHGADIATGLRRLDRLSGRWQEIDSVALVRERAERVLAFHGLHAADALQLAAALVFASDRPRGRSFVTADEPLAAAAGREGFDVLVPA